MSTPENTTKLLNALGAHLKVVVVDKVAHKGNASPFGTFHNVSEGAFYINAAETTEWPVVVHEYGHFVAWVCAGRPQRDNFGADNRDSKYAVTLEYDANCVEMVLRRRAGETADQVSDLMFNVYNYDQDLWSTDEEADVYMGRVFAHGEAMLAAFEKEVP
jgi:hypothetical protein